jgi:hypothetical protein
MVAVVHADERGIHGPPVVVGLEEPIEPPPPSGQTVLTQTFIGPAARLSHVP